MEPRSTDLLWGRVVSVITFQDASALGVNRGPHSSPGLTHRCSSDIVVTSQLSQGQCLLFLVPYSFAVSLKPLLLFRLLFFPHPPSSLSCLLSLSTFDSSHPHTQNLVYKINFKAHFDDSFITFINVLPKQKLLLYKVLRNVNLTIF